MQCPQCQHANPEDARFCNACGAQLDASCLACGHGSPAGSRFCNACGASLRPPTPAPRPVQPATQPAPTLEGERRQVTVVFADLSGFTALSERLDPEAVRHLMNACFARMVPVVEKYAGTVDKFIGDAIMALFGAPIAHENDAERAIRAALEMMEALTVFNAEQGTDLGLHCGINTGLVIAGGIGTDARQEYSVIGDAVNLAARLEDTSERGEIFVGPETYHVTRPFFTFEALEPMALKGKAEPVLVYRVLGETPFESRFDAATATGLTPLVGREEELGLVLRRWEQVKDGEGQVVLLGGEPGIGKSRITQTLAERLAEEPHIRVRYQCSPYYTNSAFHPIITQLERAAQFSRDDTPDQKLDKLEVVCAQSIEPVTPIMSLVAALLSIPTADRYPSLNVSPQRQKALTITAVVDQLLGLSGHHPVLCLVEDVHWSDPTTLDVLDLLVQRAADVSALVVITYRPEFTPLWGGVAHVTTQTLNRLSRRQVATLVTGVTGGKTLPDAVLDQIADKTDGVPLFVEELTKTVLESELLVDQGDHYALTTPLPPLAIPATLQDALMARLDRLAPVKEVAQIGAVLGREFAYELLAAVSLWPDEALHDALGQLVTAQLLVRRGMPPQATYLFRHAFIQDAAYQSWVVF